MQCMEENERLKFWLDLQVVLKSKDFFQELFLEEKRANKRKLILYPLVIFFSVRKLPCRVPLKYIFIQPNPESVQRIPRGLVKSTSIKGFLQLTLQNLPLGASRRMNNNGNNFGWHVIREISSAFWTAGYQLCLEGISLLSFKNVFRSREYSTNSGTAREISSFWHKLCPLNRRILR